MTTYRDVLKKASKIIDNFDAELILSHVTGKSRAKIFSAMKSSLLEIDEFRFWQFAQKRSKGFPLAYITGVKEFWKGEFKVNKNVLIPRPETEVLIEELLKEDLEEKKLIELGTGSGCIAISIANEINDLSIYATDFSIEAILIARENAEINKSKNIIFINHDWREEWLFPSVDFIISNPPYVDKKDIKKNADGIWYEPEIALFSENSGFADIEIIIKKSYQFLNNKGKLFLEHSPEQHNLIKKIANETNFKSVNFKEDLNKDIRFSILEK